MQDRIERLLGNASAGGAGAGFVAAAVTYPLDLVRTRVAGHVRASGEARKRSATQVTIALVREQGVLGLYGGAVPTFVGALFFEGARFGIYRWLMDSVFDSDHWLCATASGITASMVGVGNRNFTRQIHDFTISI